LWDVYDGKGGWDLTETYDQFDGGNNIKDIMDIILGDKIYYTKYGNGQLYAHQTPLSAKEFYEGWVSSGKPQINELNELVKHHFKEYKNWKVFSPVNLHIYDSKGNHIGVNETTGGIDREIVGSYYSGPDSHPQEIFVICDDDDNQTSCVIEGKEEGTFTLEFENAENGKVVNTTYENVPVKKGSLGYLETNIEDGQHLLKMDFDGNGVIDESFAPNHITIDEGDDYPPSSISNLQSTNGTTWINWTWINPKDSYFNHTEIYLNGTFQTNTSVEYFNATGLQPETSYTLGTRTVDNNGNVNETWVNSTATTGKNVVSDVEKPVIESVVLSPTSTYTGSTISIRAHVTDNTGIVEVTAGEIMLTEVNGIWQGSVTASSTPGDYSISIKAKGTSGNYAEISVPYKVLNNNAQVPEFPSVALPVVAVLGIIAIIGRRKE